MRNRAIGVVAVPGILILSIALWAAPAGAVSLYLNSYGWDDIYRYDTVTGSTTLITATDILSTGFCDAADFGPDGFLYAGAAYDIYRINLSGPQAVWSQYLTLSQQFDSGLTFSPNGTMYLADSSTMWAINSSGGTIPGSTVNVTCGGQSVYLSGIGFAPNGTLFGADPTSIYRINAATGAATVACKQSNSSGGIFTH